MDDATRREVFGAVVGAAALAVRTPEADEKLERERMLACGFTEAEAECWLSLNRTAAKFFDLPKLHVMDDHELAHAVHVLQYRLLSRPAYRKYRTPPPKPGDKK